jgi:starch synthase
VEILHLHDWTAALAAVLLATRFRDDPALADLRVVQSIHNLAHPGSFQIHTLDALGLSRELAAWNLMGHHGEVSWLKGGLLLADVLHTVSPRYAQEILTPEEGQGLDALLRLRRDALVGVLNGLDFDEWDPATNEHLPAPFTAADLAGKERCKRALQEEMGLKVDLRPPLVGFVGRLAHQKGVDLLLDAAPNLLDKGAQLVVLGSGDATLERRVRELAEAYPRRAAAFIGYERAVTHRILAGCDLVVMPSRFEPCGLTQMQAMRYGTVPVAHAVGGLVDTIIPVSARALARNRATGFLFRTPSARALSLALGRALKLYAQKRKWLPLVRSCMDKDWSWESARPGYAELYRRAAAAGAPWRRGVDLPRPAPEEPSPPAFLDWGPDLPGRHHENAVRLMVQSPRKLYLYWEVAPYRSSGPFRLRLIRPDTAWIAGEDLPEVGEWWIDADPGLSYRAEILGPGDTVLLASNAVLTPRDTMSDRTDVRWLEAEERRRRHLAARARVAAARGEPVPDWGREEELVAPGGYPHPHLRRSGGAS